METGLTATCGWTLPTFTHVSCAVCYKGPNTVWVCGQGVWEPWSTCYVYCVNLPCECRQVGPCGCLLFGPTSDVHRSKQQSVESGEQLRLARAVHISGQDLVPYPLLVAITQSTQGSEQYPGRHTHGISRLQSTQRDTAPYPLCSLQFRPLLVLLLILRLLLLLIGMFVDADTVAVAVVDSSSYSLLT